MHLTNSTNNVGVFVPYSVEWNDTEHILLDDNFLHRMQRIRNSQQEYSNLFNKLNNIIGQLKEKYPLLEESNDYETISNVTDASSGVSTSSEVHTTTSSCGNKRKKWQLSESDDQIDFTETDALDEFNNAAFPKRIKSEPPVVIIGPNGTQVQADVYDEIVWNIKASATRSLLSLVFTGDVLATHTLTGKPSPAFYGRERPLKMQLDPLKTADIIHCVRVKSGASEREVRSSITTKCADTAKKYKRRSEKKLKRI